MNRLAPSLLVVSLLANTHCSGRPLVESMDSSASVDAVSNIPDEWTVPSTCPAVPFVVGGFDRVYVPANQRYLNDHTVVRGDDGQWHLFGITNTGNGMPQSEIHLLHASAPALDGEWIDRDDVLSTTGDEAVMWAPHVFRAPSGTWVMYYWAGSRSGAANGLRVATSTDPHLDHWTRLAPNDEPDLRPPGGRDPFVYEVNGSWLLYSVWASPVFGTPEGDRAFGRITVSRSDDPTSATGWGEPTTVIEDPRPDFTWGNLESPFVVANECGYYLFVTRWNVHADTGDYQRTVVFHSRDPEHFEFEPITEIPAHAAEIVTDEEGRQWITRAGWPTFIGEANRGLSIARLAWARVQGTDR